MSELSGEKIEELLWEAGCEVLHDGGLTEVSPITVNIGENKVIITEAWFESGSWFADTDTLVLELYAFGEKVAEDLEVFENEEELVEHIVRLGEDG